MTTNGDRWTSIAALVIIGGVVVGCSTRTPFPPTPTSLGSASRAPNRVSQPFSGPRSATPSPSARVTPSASPSPSRARLAYTDGWLTQIGDRHIAPPRFKTQPGQTWWNVCVKSHSRATCVTRWQAKLDSSKPKGYCDIDATEDCGDSPSLKEGK